MGRLQLGPAGAMTPLAGSSTHGTIMPNTSAGQAQQSASLQSSKTMMPSCIEDKPGLLQCSTAKQQSASSAVGQGVLQSCWHVMT